MSSINARLWFDRNIKFSLILQITINEKIQEIIITDPYIYDKDQWIFNHDLIRKGDKCIMNFNNVTLHFITNNRLIIDAKDEIIKLRVDKIQVLDCIKTVINSNALSRYKYWTMVRPLIK